MPTDAAQITTIRTQTYALIVDMTLNPKPSYDIDGQSISWANYLKQLQATINWCDQQEIGNAPFEIISQAYT